MRYVWLALAACAMLGIAACHDLDFGDNPRPEVSKADATLTAFPTHLRDGSSQ